MYERKLRKVVDKVIISHNDVIIVIGVCIAACFSTATKSVCWSISPPKKQIELIDRVDDIYRNTTWNDEFKGYGVQIQQVCVAWFSHSLSHSFRFS